MQQVAIGTSDAVGWVHEQATELVGFFRGDFAQTSRS